MLNGPRFARRSLDVVARLFDFLMRFLQNVPEFREFRFNRPEQRPYLAGSFFNSQCAKTHLQRIQNRGDGGRPGRRDAEFPLQLIEKARSAQHFGPKDEVLAKVMPRPTVVQKPFRAIPEAGGAT